MSLPLHKLILRDSVRMKHYASAIRKLVRPDDVAIDLGCGTGIMGFLALKSGAKKVYAIEKDDIIYLARSLAYENGFTDKVVFIHKNSAKAMSPERADILISELMSDFGVVGENILPTICDAKKRLLKRNGRVIPSKLTLMLCPVSASNIYNKDVIWSKVQGIKMGYLGKLAQNSIIWLRQMPKHLLSKPKGIYTINLSKIISAPEIISCQTSFTVTHNGVFHGLVAWFIAELAPAILLDSSKGTHWRPLLFPLHPSTQLKVGDKIRVRFLIGKDYSDISWLIKVSRNGKEILSSRHSSRLGLPRIWKGIFK